MRQMLTLTPCRRHHAAAATPLMLCYALILLRRMLHTPYSSRRFSAMLERFFMRHDAATLMLITRRAAIRH